MTNNKKIDKAQGSIFKALLFAPLIGFIGAFVLMLILSGVCLTSKDPDGLIGWLAMAALLGGALICGIISARLQKERAISTAIIGGAIYILLFWLISLFFRHSGTNPMPPLGMSLRYGACLLVSLFGGLGARGSRPRIRSGKHSPTAMARRQLKRR